MTGATYHLTAPAQLDLRRAEQRRTDQRVIRSVERTAHLTRTMCTAPVVSMSRALSALALAALVACGGGGGGGGGGAAFMPVAATPVAQEPKPQEPVLEPLKLNPVNPGCTVAADGHVDCPLIASGELIGVGVPAGTYVRFTNNTGSHLQVDEVRAATGEVSYWNEHCVYLGELVTGQHQPGVGEVGCSAKNVGENYAPITWGAGTGLSVAPGQAVYVNSNQTSAGYMNTTYALRVRVQTTGLHAWRAPQHDEVISCDGRDQSTAGMSSRERNPPASESVA